MRRTLIKNFFKIRAAQEQKSKSSFPYSNERISMREFPRRNDQVKQARSKNNAGTFTFQIPREDPDAAYAGDEHGNVTISRDDVCAMSRQLGIDYARSVHEGKIEAADTNDVSKYNVMKETKDYHKSIDVDEVDSPKLSRSDMCYAIAEKLALDGICASAKELAESMVSPGTIFIAVSPSMPLYVQSATTAQLLSISVHGSVVSFVSDVACVIAIEPSSSTYHDESFIRWVQRNMTLGTIFLTDMYSLVAWKAVRYCMQRLKDEVDSRPCRIIDASFGVADALQVTSEEDDRAAALRVDQYLRSTATLGLDLSIFGWHVSMPVNAERPDSVSANASSPSPSKTLVQCLHRFFTQAGSSSYTLASTMGPKGLPQHFLQNPADIILCAPRTSASGVRERYFMEEICKPADDQKQFIYSSILSDGSQNDTKIGLEDIQEYLVADESNISADKGEIRAAHLRFLRLSLEYAIHAAGKCAKGQRGDAAGCYVVYLTASMFAEENERIVASLFHSAKENDGGYVKWNGKEVRRVPIDSELPDFLQESKLLAATYRASPVDTSCDGCFLCILHVRASKRPESRSAPSVATRRIAESFIDFFGFEQSQLTHLSCGTFAPTDLCETRKGIIALTSGEAQTTSPDFISGLRVLNKIDVTLDISLQACERMGTAALALHYPILAAFHSAASHRYLVPLWGVNDAHTHPSPPRRHVHFADAADLLLFLYLGRLPSELISRFGDRISGWESCMYDTARARVHLGFLNKDKDLALDSSLLHDAEVMHIIPGAVLLTTTIDMHQVASSMQRSDALRILQSFLPNDASDTTITLVANVHYTVSDLASDSAQLCPSMHVKTNRAFELILPEVLNQRLRSKRTADTAPSASTPGYRIDVSVNHLVTDPFVVSLRDALCYFLNLCGRPYTYNALRQGCDADAQQLIDGVVKESALLHPVEVLEDHASVASMRGRRDANSAWQAEKKQSEKVYQELADQGIELFEETAVQSNVS